MEIRVDNEFETKIPPLTEEEFRNLEQSILAAGEIYSPIIIWNGIVVDGHNRYRILEKHPELKYSLKEMYFTDRGEALSWICWNQLGRRNLTSLQKKYLMGNYLQHCAFPDRLRWRCHDYQENRQNQDPLDVEEKMESESSRDSGLIETFCRF